MPKNSLSVNALASLLTMATFCGGCMWCGGMINGCIDRDTQARRQAEETRLAEANRLASLTPDERWELEKQWAEEDKKRNVEAARKSISEGAPGLRHVAQVGVREILVSPSSAEFPDKEHPSWAWSLDEKTGVVTMTGVVESKNRLGVMLRSRWRVTMRFEDSGKNIRVLNATLLDR